jgi:hypothetical protein
VEYMTKKNGFASFQVDISVTGQRDTPSININAVAVAHTLQVNIDTSTVHPFIPHSASLQGCSCSTSRCWMHVL